MENRTLEELNDFAESLDVEIGEIKNSLSSYITKADLKNQSNIIFNQLSKSIDSKIDSKFTEASGKYESAESLKDDVLSVVYTKDEIDGKKYLTQHQSLADYATKDFVKEHYVNKYDIHNVIKCNCLTPNDLTSALQNYVTFQDLSSSLENYYIKTDIDNKIDDVKNQIPSLDIIATKNYVDSVKTNLINAINKTYLSIEDASKTYLSLLEHTSYKDYVDDTYLKISDFDALGVINIDTIKNYATKSDLANYALNSTVSTLSDNIRNTNSKVLKLGQTVNTLSTSLEKNYLKKSDLLKTFYTKSDADELFLTKNDASETYLTRTNASNSYLTKNEALHTYLQIEDYKRMKLSISLVLNDKYKNDVQGFNTAWNNGEITANGFYIVGGYIYVVKDKNLYTYMGNNEDASDYHFIDAYTKTEIDNFNFAPKEWVKENFKCKEWIITNEY